MSDIDISFITVNYRTPALVERLIESIHKSPPPLSYEIIVVDNASGDGIEESLRARFPDIKILVLPENIGFGGGNNRGAELARGRIIALINSDCEIREESFEKPARYLDENPGVGILGLKVITPAGQLEQTARGFPSPSTGLFGRSTMLGRLAQRRDKLGRLSLAKRNFLVDPDAKEPYEVDWVAGTVMLIKRDCWNALGGFDEGYFMYWEDADLCCRALNKNYKAVFFPGSIVVHVASGSSSRNPVPSIRYFHQSAYRYVTKNISPGWSLLRAFAWVALKIRAAVLIAKARSKLKKMARENESK